MMNAAWSNRRAIAAVALSGALLSAGIMAGRMPALAQNEQKQKEAVSQANAISVAFRNAAQKAMPTVVTIKSRAKATPVTSHKGGGEENPFKGTPLEDFFHGDLGRQFRQFTPPRNGVGSGVIIDKSGLILTNNHVVDGADEVVVELSDGREFKATDVKTDSQTDLAVVRISGAGTLPEAHLGNSDKLEIGDWVIAIGNPFELEMTVSAGIISGKGRELGSVERGQFIQTDAAINPGNSGGPLVNLDGEVVGINTAIASNNGGYQGIGFAIPINLAKWVTTQLIEKGSVERAYLGVKIGEVSSELAEQLGVQRGAGVLVAEVLPGTPAAEAGFQEGDVITEFAAHKVQSPRTLQEMVERAAFDSHQEVKVLRDGKPVTLSVVVKRLPNELVKAGPPATTPEGGSEDKGYSNEKLGMQVSDLGAEEAEKLGYHGMTGALVTAVEPGGLAFQKGIREGMLIRRVGRTMVANEKEFQSAVENASVDDGLLMLVRTPQGNQFFVVLKAS